MRRSALALLAVLLCHATVVPAQQTAIPPDLKPWESWVLYGEEFRRCPVRDGEDADGADAFVCTWPGRMHVAVSSGGGEFRQSWRIYAESWIALPGDSEHWPEDLRVDGTPAAAVERDGVPQLRLSAGDHTISGSFTWARRPESLQLAPATALVDLSIDGKSIAPVELREGRLWLGAVRTVTVAARIASAGLPAAPRRHSAATDHAAAAQGIGRCARGSSGARAARRLRADGHDRRAADAIRAGWTTARAGALRRA